MWGDGLYYGTTTINDGTLVLNGTLMSETLVNSGGVLGGRGTVSSNVTVTAATLAPGASAGILSVVGAVSLDSDSTFEVDLDGTVAGVSHDQLKVTGTLDLGGCTLSVQLGVLPQLGDSYTIIDNDAADAVTGQFAEEDRVTGFYNGTPHAFRITYDGGDGNDVVLQSIPIGTVVSVH